MALNKHSSYLQMIIDASPDIIVIKDSQGRWMETNVKTLTLFQIDQHIYKGKTEQELGFIYPHYAPFVSYFLESDQQAWETGAPFIREETFVVQGTELVFEVVKTPIYDSDGKPDTLVVIGRDVTERLKNEQRYKSFFTNHPEAVYSLDVTGSFIDVNKEAERLIGYTVNELRGTNFAPMINPADLPAVLESFEKVQQGKPQKIQTKIIQKNSTLRDVSLSTIPALLNGKIVGIQGIAQDITDKKQTIKKIDELQRVLQDTIRQQQGLIFRLVKQNGQFIHTLSDGELLRELGFSPADIVGNPLEEFLEKEKADAIHIFYEQAWSGKKISFEGSAKNGSVLYFASLSPIYRDGKVVEVIGSAVNITERKKAERALRESEERYRIIAENSSDMIRVIDQNLIFVYASPSNQRVLGHAPENLIGKPIIDFLHPDDQKMAFSLIQSVFSSQQSVSQTIRFRTENQQWKWVESTLSPVVEEKVVNSIVVVSRDVTDRKKLEEQLRFMAYHDVLTTLPNRRLFDEVLQSDIKAAQNSGQKLAVFYFDIDRFKLINDILGHNIGDLLLAAVANRMQSQLQKEAFFARVGGDEFALLIRDAASIEGIEEIAKRILLSLQTPFNIEGQEMHITSSIGISLFPEYTEDAAELLKQADLAMYNAKEKGKNNYCFYSLADNAQKNRKLYLENDLRKALLYNELSLVYQPKMTFDSKRITACEALLRWHHSSWGPISPEEFIPIAEESGLIIPIGEWIIQEAFQQQNRWLKKGLPPIQTAINLSLKQLLSEGFLQMVCRMLQKYEINPAYIEFEITESAMMKDLESTLHLLKELKKIGIGIAIDDFGTGYSSLAHLKRFPLDIVKIDRSFIQGLPDDEEDKAITTLITTMGKHLNLTVVAEGIETKEQFHFLQEAGCDQYQGFFFSRPVSGEKLAEMIAEFI